MGLRPLHDWVLIRRTASEEKTSGGIIIPEVAKEKPAEGIVDAIGPGRYKKEPGKKGRFIPTVLKPGQRIYFTEYMAKDVAVGGREYTFIREEDVLGLIEESRAVAVKKDHPIIEKKDHPVLVQTGPKAAQATPTPAEKKKPATKKSAVEKTNPGPKTTKVVKKSEAANKAAPAKKTAKKPASKTAAKKKSPVKKTAAKKPAPKKPAVKKATAKKAVKKTSATAKKRNRK